MVVIIVTIVMTIRLCLLFLVIYVQDNGGPETDSRHERIVGGSILVWHYPLAGLVLVDEHMVRSPVGGIRKTPERIKSGIDDGGYQPVRQW